MKQKLLNNGYYNGKTLTLSGRKAVTGLLFVLPLILGFIFLFAVPMFNSFMYSVGEIELKPDGFGFKFTGFQNYKNIFFEHTTFLRSFTTTLKDVALEVPLILVFSFFIAVLLNQKFKGRMWVRALFFLPVIVSCGVVMRLDNQAYVESHVFHGGSGDGTVMSNMLGGIQLAEYLKDLGITHLQVLPVNSFYGIDEEKKDQYYNWGYNPLEYMTLTGWYATKPNDAYNKINEFKRLIDVYHQNNICINLDVVFNHVYQHNMFSYGKLVPGYCFRCDEIGFMTNGSYCGNDLATEHLMIRRLIIDTCKFFTKFYNIDGFRFDLMGLIDITTMKQLEEDVKDIMFIGE